MLEIYCQKNTAVIIKMVGKICYKEPQGPFKAYIKKQNRYCCLKMYKKRTNNLSIMPQQVVNKLHKNQHVLIVVLRYQVF